MLDDFTYYWMHRLHHEVRLLWAGHVSHHSAIKMNYATALRHLATAKTRSSYTAVSNTVLGLFLLCGSGLGIIDALYGSATVLLLLLVTCLIAGPFCFSLRPVD